MHTLKQLKDGELQGNVSLRLSEGLSHFPEEIFGLADTLEVLDLSGNELSALPAGLGRLKKLRILFCSDNLFTELPEVLGDCPLLDMVGFKANKIETVPPRSLNPNLRWLILTDNSISEIPRTVGNCSRMQKLMLAGNRLSDLPEELANCSDLSLLRISANRLNMLPKWLLSMPRLAWLAFSGNKFTMHPGAASIPAIKWSDINIQHILGQGASGVIFKGSTRFESKPQDVAVKVFKGAVTSDGLPEDEMNAFIAAGTHPVLVPLIGQISGHPEGKKGVVMQLIADHFYNLGMSPTFETCTRDAFPEHVKLSVAQVLKIAAATASLAGHLHSKGIMHGDLYAHNILVDDEGNTLIGDFGAASFYNKADTNNAFAIERIEVRAFGYLLDDLLTLCNDATHSVIKELTALRDACLVPDASLRPGFSYLDNEMARLRDIRSVTV
jgi:hypothetical protein